MRVRTRWRLLGALVLLGGGPAWSTSASAQRDGISQPATQHTLTPAGETEVNYFSGGSLTHSTQIPTASAFNTTGRGAAGGGAAQPCFAPFTWSTEEPNPNAVTDPTTGGLIDSTTGLPTTPTVQVETSQASTAWIFTELTPTGQWSPETQGQMDAQGGGPGGIGVGPTTLTSPTAVGDSYRALNQPLQGASRRFQVNCGVPAAYTGGAAVYGPNGPLIGYRDIPMSDPFWNPLVRLGILWGMVQLPAFRVIAPPEVGTYGGLVVNMPTWFQIEAAAWRPYFTAVDEYMGWQSQLGLFPHALQFEVVGEGGGTIPCAPTDSGESGGAIPAWPKKDLPRYYELGQLNQDCSWVPQARGTVTVRARITYNVLLTISGFSEWLSPYIWYSDPLTMTVGELRSVNVTPEGGIGG
jgi:hypothetical protein